MNMESNFTQTPNAIPTNAMRTIGTDTECASLPFNNLRAINNSRFTPVNFVPDKIKANLRNKRTPTRSFQDHTSIPLHFFPKTPISYSLPKTAFNYNKTGNHINYK